jgi:hypothetical protein
MAEMTEDLSIDGYVLDVSATASSSVTIEVQDVKIDVQAELEKSTGGGDVEVKTKPVKAAKPSKATKPPTAYNIFIKTTCEELITTHVNLTPRERYALAIQMWNDRKGKT